MTDASSPAVIAVDGPSGSGKSTVASRVAHALGWQHLDTGSMYRAITFLVLDADLAPDDEAGISAMLPDVELTPALDGAGTVTVGTRVLDAELRSEMVTKAVSAVSAQRAVRDQLVAAQRALAAKAGGLVMEGRDIGTVVIPQAPLKVYLTASEEVRAARRAGQAPGPPASATAVQADLRRRDRADSSRAISPLAPAADAVYLDTSTLTSDEVVATVLARWAETVAREEEATATPAKPATPTPATATPAAPTPATPTPAAPTPATPTPAAPTPATPTPATAARVATATPVEPRIRPDTRRLGSRDFPAYSPALVSFLKPPARRLFKAVWKIEVTGRENVPTTGPVLIVGNHAGALDGPFVVAFTKRPVRILAKIELYEGTMGSFLSRVGQIPVDRGRPDRVALHAGIGVLKGGGILGIFPEGTRANSGEVRDVRGGAAYLALHAPCTIIPVVCTGTSEAFPKGARRPNRSVPIYIDFGAPIAIHVDGDPRARSSVATATDQIRTGMTNHLEQVRRRRATS